MLCSKECCPMPHAIATSFAEVFVCYVRARFTTRYADLEETNQLQSVFGDALFATSQSLLAACAVL
jgi:hypothetical protein